MFSKYIDYKTTFAGLIVSMLLGVVALYVDVQVLKSRAVTDVELEEKLLELRTWVDARPHALQVLEQVNRRLEILEDIAGE